ncbi:Na+/H+ antiporter subunit D [Marinitenerispora sediminis]|uniref:Na+/H+ antiporter subunit D n=1 Tax=Marinitenerispora sediminis TaxID=1931232 RepID=A0A368TB57_9ACTN|nr:Na+/H+ antiporter subunit D [Marinitenerispora sediminis]RCV56989.1 Na+/H+ antiporter subunit D [Marinitenerispora sediminis]RCV60194.1 Na+/H+ antiporter subunit D [Marinitenerispora sediminis]RCV62099.1 Na+/H+ antiporter subunit D [Marinitenerispora sediminis]
MNVLLAVPLVVPLIGAAVTLLLRAAPRAQRITSTLTLAGVVAAAALLVARTADGDVVASQAGGWAAPLGITLVADPLAALLVLVSSVVLLIVLLYAIGQDVGGLSRAMPQVFHPIYLVLTAGVCLSFIAGDLFNLFVGFEIMLTASYTLITQAPTRARVRASMIYTVVSLTSSILFLTGIALVYALTGTVNMADIAEKLGAAPPELRAVLALLFFVVFGIKAAIVPMHFWLPDSYPVAITRISAIFAALLTKVAVYAIIRTQTLLFARDDISAVMLWVAIATMVVGILGALVQDDVNRVMSFALVSHIGFMIFGLALNTVAGLAGVVVYLVHHIVVQATLFLVNGLMRQYVGHTSLRAIRGLTTVSPALALFFFLPALSLAGLPPMSGFIAKVALFEAGLAAGGWLVYTGIAAGVLTSLLTMMAIFRIWTRAFWGTPLPDMVEAKAQLRRGANLGGLRFMTAMTGVMVGLGLVVAAAAGPLAEFSFVAARDLLDGGAYVQAVLGGGAP